MHGYELRRQVAQLSGYTRPVSDGSLYPAINRLVRGRSAGTAPGGGTAAARNVLTLTSTGRHDLERRLREPAEVDITDLTRFLVVLAFLSFLPDADERDRCCDAASRSSSSRPASSTTATGPCGRADLTDPYRRGMFVIAGATSTAERAGSARSPGSTDPMTQPAQT